MKGLYLLGLVIVLSVVFNEVKSDSDATESILNSTTMSTTKDDPMLNVTTVIKLLVFIFQFLLSFIFIKDYETILNETTTQYKAVVNSTSDYGNSSTTSDPTSPSDNTITTTEASDQSESSSTELETTTVLVSPPLTTKNIKTTQKIGQMMTIKTKRNVLEYILHVLFFVVLAISVFFGGLYLYEIYNKFKLRKPSETKVENQEKDLLGSKIGQTQIKERASSEPSVKDISEKKPSIYTQASKTSTS